MSQTTRNKNGFAETEYFGNIVPHWYAYPPKSSYRDSTHLEYEELIRSLHGTINVYVHVPFCNMKCSFCSLFTTAGSSSNAIDRYIEALTTEISTFSSQAAGKKFDVASVYVGGGTPSVLPAKHIDRIVQSLEKIGANSSTPKTVEFSPEATDQALARHWASSGFSRASIGVQSFHDERLKSLKRHHSAGDAERALVDLRQAGFNEVNADLIFGHIDQEPSEWREDLERLTSSAATSCTFHPLAIHPKTGFERRIAKESQSAMTRKEKHAVALEHFASTGWERTSAISASRQSIANPIESAESRGVPTVGFGAGARSYFEEFHLSTLPASRRMAFGEVLKEYFSAIEAGRKPALSLLRLNVEELARKNVVLKLHHGLIDYQSIMMCDLHPSTHDVRRKLEQFAAERLLQETDDGFALTQLGATECGHMGAMLASELVRRGLAERLASQANSNTI